MITCKNRKATCVLSTKQCLLCSSGVRNADQSELMKIVTDPHEEHLMLSPDFSFLENLLPKLSRRICFTASEPPRPIKQNLPGSTPIKSLKFTGLSDPTVCRSCTCSNYFPHSLSLLCSGGENRRS